MMREDLYDQIEMEDLSGDVREIAELCGLDVAILIMRRHPGAQLNIAKTAHHGFARRYIAAHPSLGRNELVLSLGVSGTFVANIRKELEKN